MAIFERGTHFAGYLIVRTLNTRLGASRAAVYEVTDPGGHRLALKVIEPDLPLTAKPQGRLGQEGDTLALIEHLNVLRYHDGGIEDGRTWMVRELVDGPDLRQLLREHGGALPVERALRILRQACEGMAAVHALEILHRDLKPENILIGAGDVAKVADFGSAKGGTVGLKTTNDQDLNDAHYMAPEYIARGVAQERSDVYSMGVMLYEVVTGRHPIAPEPTLMMEVMRRQAMYDPPPLATLGLGLPGDLSDLVRRTMSKRPELRPSMRELADEIGVVLQRLNAPRRAIARALPLPGRGDGMAPTQPAMMAFGAGGTLRMAAFLDRPASERGTDRSAGAAPEPSSGDGEEEETESGALSGPAVSGPGAVAEVVVRAVVSVAAPTRRSREETPVPARGSTTAPTEGAARVSRGPRGVPAVLGGVGVGVLVGAAGVGWVYGGRAVPVSAGPGASAVVVVAPAPVASGVASAVVPVPTGAAAASASVGRVKAPVAPQRRQPGPQRGKLPF